MEENLMSYEKVTQLHSQLIIGTKQTMKAMKNNEVIEVFIAIDADEHIVNKIIAAANKHGIPYVEVDSKKELGKACNIEVAATVVAIKRAYKITTNYFLN